MLQPSESYNELGKEQSMSSVGDMEGRALCYSYLIPQKKGKSSDQFYISLTANANMLKLVLNCQSWEGVKTHTHTIAAASAEFCMKWGNLRGL